MLKKAFAFLLVFTLVLGAFSGVGAFAAAPDSPCKNVILLIGSGISEDHITATAIKTGKNLNLNKIANHGSLGTLNANDATTDAASAATSLASGYKTLNYYVGLDTLAKPLPLITEVLKENGKKIGIITDKYINDATTAAFSAHTALRTDLNAIARQQAESNFDLYFGGGSKYFDNYRVTFKGNKTKYITSPKDMYDLTADSGKVFGAFSNYSFDTGYNVPSLGDMLIKATEVLDNDNGFFIVAEGGLIDKYSFERNMTAMNTELLKFDDAVGEAMAYVDAHPDTLLVVAGDCEAGDLTLPAQPKPSTLTNNCFKTYSTSKSDTVYYAYGTAASVFGGYHDNTDIPKLIAACLGIDGFASETPKISSDKDYAIGNLNSFTGWNFSNIRKNSTFAGISMTTTSSNNSAVTTMCSKGTSLIIMANARVGFDITYTSPLASPFTLVSGAGKTLSDYDGFAFVGSGFEDVPLTVTVGNGGDFSASAVIVPSMANGYKDILVPFDAFEPSLTADKLSGLNTLRISGTAGTSKATIKIDSINAYSEDKGPNYYEVMADAYTKNPQQYTAASFNDFRNCFESFLAAATRDDRYAAKQKLLTKIDALVPVAEKVVPFSLIEANKDSITSVSAYTNVSDNEISVFCGASDSSITFGNIPAASGVSEYIRVKVDSVSPELTMSDEFSVALSVECGTEIKNSTVNRPVMTDGYIYFDISVDTAKITSVTLSFNGGILGAKLLVKGFEFITQPPVKSALINRPSALEILRASAGLCEVIGGDLDGDGVLTVTDALIALRAETGIE